MPITDLSQLPIERVMVLPDLTASICQDIAQLANPSATHHPSEERFAEIKNALNDTCKRLKTNIAQSTQTESQEIVLLHEAIKAAIEVIELLHQPA